MFKESNARVTKWRDIDYDVISDDENVEQFYEDPYASQIKRKSLYSSGQTTINKNSLSIYGQNNELKKLSASDFNHRIEYLYTQFPEVPSSAVTAACDWSTDKLDSSFADFSILQLLHDFCFGTSFFEISSSKVLEQIRRVIPTFSESTISYYISTLIKETLDNEDAFEKHLPLTTEAPVTTTSNLKREETSKTDMHDLQYLQLDRYIVSLPSKINVNTEYTITNNVTYRGQSNSIIINVAHVSLCDASLNDAFSITFPNPVITLKRGKTESIEMIVQVKKPNLQLQELINVEISNSARLFFIFKCSTASSIFSVYPKYLPCSIDHDSNVYVPNALQYLKKKLIINNGYHTSRIFREAALKTEKDDAMDQLNNGCEISYKNPSLYANLILSYYRSLKKPLLYFVTSDILMSKRSNIADYHSQASIMYEWISQIEKCDQDLIIFLADIICQVLMNYTETQMNIESFCVLLMPNLFEQSIDPMYLASMPILKKILSGWLIDRMISTLNFTYDILKDMQLVN